MHLFPLILNLHKLSKNNNISLASEITKHKSTLYSLNPSNEIAVRCAELLGCKCSSWPFTYVGYQVGSSSNRKSFWKPILTKVKTRLSLWKAHVLNKAGRTVLIKSVLNSLPTHWLSSLKAPKGVLSSIDQIRRRFFWKELDSSDNPVKKMHMIKWSTICASKSNGGLGLGSLIRKNDARSLVKVVVEILKG